MRLLHLIFLFILFLIVYGDDMEKYRALREQCERTPSNSECLKIRSKFLQLLEKCLKIKTQQQATICQEMKLKLCAIFPSSCAQASTKKTFPRTTRKSIKPKSIRTTTTTTKSKVTTVETLSNEEFVKVPVNPEELRTRGEYCIRHGKEKKCQQLLTNLKTTYSSCSQKKPQTSITKPEQLDCHSFRTHLCKAFPKFPPCIKKKP